MKKQLLLGAIGLALCAAPLWAEETVVPRFDINRIQLEGNTVLPAPEVAAILKKYTGPQKDFGTLQEAMDELESAYRGRGYTLVTVILPEQELERGTVVMNVIEPVVSEILVEGNRHYSRDNILNALPTLKVGVPPRVAAISENLRAANENPGRKLTLQFRAEEKETELKAQVQVQDQKPWKVALSGDNTGSTQSGYYRTGLTLQHANLWDRDHVATLQYTTSPDHVEKVKIISGAYRIPLYGLGDTIDLFGGYSDVDNGKIADVISGGKGIVSGVRYNLMLPRIGAYEQKLILGFDYRFYDNTLKLGATDFNLLAPDHVVHPFSIAYGGSWSSDIFAFEGSLGVVHNEPWGGQGTRDYYAQAFQVSRPDTVVDYWAFRYGFNKLIYLPNDWLLRSFGSGQYTPDRLIPGEQLGLGGANSVRGYEEREESWDAGFSGSIELYTPDMARLLAVPRTQFRLAGFFDGGVGYNLRAKPGELESNSLTSAGVGFRLGIGDLFSFSLDWGHALDNSSNTRRGGNAVHFKGALVY
ncbi:ShlB/FhaC/HecB family hemolysin secretion/activation protein [Trichlorobacter ammonificans]|uniref:Hemolysin activation/secretion protein n=1 Tax=Trichlorobacter ammonificans TaxID=2916410 RepID=A0ABM9DBM9_9BACT|nr:ShlB/FhaC/HecB family hemolysin secretion/activation protein [Trichlorobacter ammonificans]CAH2032637.1 Hemolysin activation/secretion protein [Trichlorobacter ammonificans]